MRPQAKQHAVLGANLWAFLGRVCRVSRFLGLILTAGVVNVQHSPAPNTPPDNLLCEAMQEPLGIDIVEPRFSWQMRESRRGARQTAYEIRVASSLESLTDQPDVWDSKKIESDQSINRPYGGPRLQSRRRYYWQVRTWDGRGEVSPYSPPSWWEMGLLSTDDWKAKWITRDQPLRQADQESEANWIWAADDNGVTHATGGRHEFRLHLNLPEKPIAATLFITARDNVAAWINGNRALEPAPVFSYGPRKPWGYIRELAVGQFLVQGANVLAAEATIGQASPEQPNPAGLIALLRVQMPSGKTLRFVSGTDWKTAAQQPGNWFTMDFDDAYWPAAVAVRDAAVQPQKFPWSPLPASLLRREFRLEKPVRSARIYSTSLGSYQIYMNGARVGSDILAPGWTDYRKRVVYQVYDVTSQLKAGQNAIGVILGDGWFASALTWNQVHYNFGFPPVRLLLQLEIEYADASREIIFSDESWKSAQSPILASELYNGETYDARLEQSGWNQPFFSDAAWEQAVIAPQPTAPLVAQDYQPMMIEDTLKPQAVTNPRPGVYIFDLGQNMVGWARLRVSGLGGTRIQLRFGEVLTSTGDLYTDNLRSADVTDTYILRGGSEELFEPHFTFHGFRYIEITGYQGPPPRSALEGVVFHTASPFTMQFHTANEMVNQLRSNILWGQRGNFLSVPTDCPQRDERLGWMGDAEIFWRTATFNANLQAFSHKFTTDIRDAQEPSGAFTEVSPASTEVGSNTPGWADAGVIIPWTAYAQYADPRILEENWPAMEKWMVHVETANPDHLWLHERGGDEGDWLAIGSKTSKDLIATAYWAYDAALMTRMARILQRPSDQRKYSELFNQIRAAFNRRFAKARGKIGNGSQTSQVLALQMGLLPDDRVEAAVNRLVSDIKTHNWHLTTGFLGTPYLLPILSQYGRSDVAYRLLLQTTFPSWGYMIDRGATTMWERWNGDQMMGDPEMNSFNHYAYGAVAEWLYRYVAGIDEDPDSPGFHRIVLHPQFDKRMGEVDATYDSPYGPIHSHWKMGDKLTTWSVEIPANTTALLYLPAGATSRILESQQDISQCPELSFVRREGNTAVIEAKPGSYNFTIR